jgi:hypothetical protein
MILIKKEHFNCKVLGYVNSYNFDIGHDNIQDCEKNSKLWSEKWWIFETLNNFK